MAAVQREGQPSPQELLQAAERLNTSELEDLAKGVLALRRARKASLALTEEEKQTLDRIVREIPSEVRTAYRTLVEQRRAESLTEEAQQELIRLSDWIEGVEVKRLEYLAELAHQRGCRLSEFLRALGIPSPSYA